jgi:hypothetical protein
MLVESQLAALEAVAVMVHAARGQKQIKSQNLLSATGKLQAANSSVRTDSPNTTYRTLLKEGRLNLGTPNPCKPSPIQFCLAFAVGHVDLSTKYLGFGCFWAFESGFWHLPLQQGKDTNHTALSFFCLRL